MLAEVTGSLPPHVIDLFSRSSEIQVPADMEYSPDRLVNFLYDGDVAAYFSVLQLNCLSPFSFKRGVTVRLFDKRLIGGLCSG